MITRVALLCCIILCPCVFADDANRVGRGQLAQTFGLINERLSYMKEVALYKANNKLPIENLPREQLVVRKAQSKAGQAGLDESSITAFFRSQITVAKAIQGRYQHDWAVDGSLSTRRAKDLQTQVRPALLRLGEEIITAIRADLTRGGPYRDEDYALFQAQLTETKLLADDKAALFQALKQVRLN